MVLSHHLPEEYGHTLNFGLFRVCARCSAILVGAVASFIPGYDQTVVISGLSWWAIILLPLPAMFDYLSAKLDRHSCNRLHRVLSGFLLGLAVGLVSYQLLSGQLVGGVTQALWLLALLAVTIWILHVKGKLRQMADRIEQALGN
jgi:uncharacterized membrane protein